MTGRFWMVCRAPTRPVHRYPSLAEARADARRLALSTGGAYVILETVEYVASAIDATLPRP